MTILAIVELSNLARGLVLAYSPLLWSILNSFNDSRHAASLLLPRLFPLSSSLLDSPPSLPLPSPSLMRLLLWVYVATCVEFRANASSNLEATKTSEPESLTAKDNEQDARYLRRTDGKLTTAEEERALPGTLLSHDATDMVSISLLDANPSHSISSLESSLSHSLPSRNSLPSFSLFDKAKAAILDKGVGMVDVSKDELPYKTKMIFMLFKFLGVKPFTIYWRHSLDGYWVQVARTYERWLTRRKAGPYTKAEVNGKDSNV